jgi:Alcohol dehydrogenase transcription factor Myb/SANT-like
MAATAEIGEESQETQESSIKKGGASVAAVNSNKFLGRLSATQKELLISSVHERPELWDLGCKAYKNNKKKVYIWKHVADLLKCDLTGMFLLILFFDKVESIGESNF